MIGITIGFMLIIYVFKEYQKLFGLIYMIKLVIRGAVSILISTILLKKLLLRPRVFWSAVPKHLV